MNHKRIKELAKLAGAHYHPDIPGKTNRIMFWEPEFDKFIKLIVNECAMFNNKEDLYNHFEIDKEQL